jgi:hypothetical protein
MQFCAALTWFYTRVGLMATPKTILKIKIKHKMPDQNACMD